MLRAALEPWAIDPAAAARLALARIAAAPDLTLRGVGAELAARDIKVSCKAIWNFVRAEKVTFKKSLHAAEQDRPDVARRRAQWTPQYDFANRGTAGHGLCYR
jgi:transposase